MSSSSKGETDMISKYDVLTVERKMEHRGGRESLELYVPASQQEGSSSQHYNHHVGNNRFQVVLKMNTTEFLKADTESSQEAVIDKVLDIVGKQCIDTECQRAGKFFQLIDSSLLHQQDNSLLEDASCWKELSEQQARDFVRDSLEQSAIADMPQSPAVAPVAPPTAVLAVNDDNDDQKKRRRRSSLLRRSLSSGNMLEDQKKRVAMLSQLQQFDDDEDDDDDKDDQDEQQYQSDSSAGRNKSSCNISTTSNNNNSSRPVLLQRANSWSMSETSRETICTANPLDVIVTTTASSNPSSASYQLIPNHTGNNRLAVMIQLQLPKYTALSNSLREQQNMCREIVETVRRHYSGRFLVEAPTMVGTNNDVGFLRSSGSSTGVTTEHEYHALTDQQAAAAVQALFRAEQQISGNDEQQSPTDVSAVKQQQQRPSVVKKQVIQQLQNIPTTLVAATASQNDTSDSNEGNNSVTSVSDIHKVAIQSLQQRKKRQTTNTKISKLVRSGLGAGERSQSAGLAGATSLLQQPPPFLPAAVALNERYATTGMMHDPRRHHHHGITGSTATTGGGGEYYQNNKNQEWTVDDSYNNNNNSPSTMNYHHARPHQGRRMTARLSEFSQGMIKDLLVQLEVDNDDDNDDNDVGHRREYHPV